MDDPRTVLLDAFDRVPERHRVALADAFAMIADYGPEYAASRVLGVLLGLDERGWRKRPPPVAQVIELAEVRRARRRARASE
jgi:hypothetical protein